MITEEHTGREFNGSLRDPPNNIEAENCLLGTLLINNRAFDKIATKVEPDYFFDERNARVFGAIRHLMNKGSPVNPVVLKNWSARENGVGMEHIVHLVNSPPVLNNEEAYAELIYDLWVKRELLSVGQMLVADCNDDDLENTGRSIAEEADAKIVNVLQNKSNSKTVSMATAVRMVEADLEDRHKNGLTGISTGIQKLDWAMGLLKSQELVVIAGRPSMGKTALANTIAFNIAWAQRALKEMKKKSGIVVEFSLEMSTEQLGSRWVKARSGVDVDLIGKGKYVQTLRDSVAKATAELTDLPIYIDDTGKITPSAIRAVCRTLRRTTGGIACIIIDYLQIMGYERGLRFNSRNDEITYLSGEMKAIAKEFGCPVICLSQLSRALENREDKRPQLQDLRDSGAIEQDADTIAFVYREEYYLKRNQPARKDNEAELKYLSRCDEYAARLEAAIGKAEIIVAKRRRGEAPRTARIGFSAEHTWFSDLSEDNRNE